jgi:tetratricopeptide (TPR) repeat protein
VKIKIVLALALAFSAGTTQVSAADVKVQMYDYSAGVTSNKGTELTKKGDYEAARQYYDAAIRRAPKEWPPYYNRALVYARERKWELARQDFETVLRLNRGMLLAAILRGDMNEQLGNYSFALADYDRIAKITPSTWPLTLASALAHRARLRASCPDPSFRNTSRAIADAKLACDASSWAKANYVSMLAAAYAQGGDFDSAIRFEQKAIETVPHDKWLTTAEDRQGALTGCERRLAMYQRHEPLQHIH